MHLSGQLISTRVLVGRKLYGTPSGWMGTNAAATSSGTPSGYTALIWSCEDTTHEPLLNHACSCTTRHIHMRTNIPPVEAGNCAWTSIRRACTELTTCAEEIYLLPNIPKEKTMASIILRVLPLTAVGIGVLKLIELSLGLRNQTGCATVVV